MKEKSAKYPKYAPRLSLSAKYIEKIYQILSDISRRYKFTKIITIYHQSKTKYILIRKRYPHQPLVKAKATHAINRNDPITEVSKREHNTARDERDIKISAPTLPQI